MSEFNVKTETLKRSAGELGAIGGGIACVADRMESLKLHGILGNAEVAGLLRRINSQKNGVRESEEEIKRYADALSQIARRYELAEKHILSNTEVKGRSGQEEEGIKAVEGEGSATFVSEAWKNLSNEVSEREDPFSVIFPNKSSKKLAKNVVKKALKEVKPGAEKIIDIRDMVNKLQKGEIFSAMEKAPGLMDLKGWDFKKLKEIPAGSKDYSAIMKNPAVLKFQATMKALTLVTKPNGYISRYKEQYEAQAKEHLEEGNVFGALYSMSSEFVQTVGKGTVDVTCQMINDGFNSGLKAMTFGIVDLSLINSGIEDYFGVNFGKMFNSVTAEISNGVDVFLDDVLPEVGNAVFDITGKAVNAGGKLISSGIKFVRNLF